MDIAHLSLLHGKVMTRSHSTGFASGAIALAEPRNPPLKQGDDDDDRRQDERAGRSLAEILVRDRHLVEVDQRGAGQIEVTGRGPTAGENIEKLVKRLEGGDQ